MAKRAVAGRDERADPVDVAIEVERHDALPHLQPAQRMQQSDGIAAAPPLRTLTIARCGRQAARPASWSGGQPRHEFGEHVERLGRDVAEPPISVRSKPTV